MPWISIISFYQIMKALSVETHLGWFRLCKYKYDSPVFIFCGGCPSAVESSCLTYSGIFSSLEESIFIILQQEEVVGWILFSSDFSNLLLERLELEILVWWIFGKHVCSFGETTFASSWVNLQCLRSEIELSLVMRTFKMKSDWFASEKFLIDKQFFLQV